MLALKAGSETLILCQLYLEHLLLLLETRKSNTSTNKKQKMRTLMMEQMLIGQRVSGKRQVEIIRQLVSTLAIFKRKRGLVRI
jgi:hypothetical protein